MLCGNAARAGELDGMLETQDPPLTHSTGLYAFIPPSGWTCFQNKNSSVTCQSNNGPQPGSLTITHQTVEGQLDSELMALNAEDNLKKLPHYKRIGGGRLLLGDVKASIRSFTFDYQGNSEYPVAVEELYVVTGGKAIRLHFETMSHAMRFYALDLKKVYDSLGVAEVDSMGQVVQGALPRGPGRKRPNRGAVK